MGDKIRAVIYCRVSTSSDSQTESLDKQVSEAIEAVGQLGFDLADQFIDSGKTGTTKDGRKEYLRMLSRMEEHMFDVIVTKSLDRMNRNILDFYLFLDLMTKNGVKLYFYLDRDYYKADDKIVIGIKAILAEEYSRELSKKLRNAHEKRQERGDVVMLSGLTYGYRKVARPDGRKEVVVEEDEAVMIRLIFDYCREGYGVRAISGFLSAAGYLNRNGNPITEGTIRRIIRNPLVMGTMVMNKVRFDFNIKKAFPTDPSQWIWKENAVPAIIPASDWKDANAKMDARRKCMALEAGQKYMGAYGGRSRFSGKIFCGICGKPYYRTGTIKKSGRVTVWCCSTYVRFGRSKGGDGFDTKPVTGCDGLSLEEEMLVEILNHAAAKELAIIWDKQAFIGETMMLLDLILKNHKQEKRAGALEDRQQVAKRRREALLEKYLDGKVSDANYARMEKKLNEECEHIAKGLRGAGTGDVSEAGQRMKMIRTALEDGGIEQAAAYALLEDVNRMVVYQTYIELVFDSFAVKVSLEDFRAGNKNSSIGQSKNIICQLIKENPEITIDGMAQVLNLGKRTAFCRVSELKKEGRIGVKGHGPGRVWFVNDVL